jgi:hypothetical protein
LAVERIPPTIVYMSSSGLLPEWQSEAHATLAPADSLLWARIAAWLRSGHYDRLLRSGAPVHAGTPLAFHAERLTSIREREAVARALRRCLDEAYDGPPFRSARLELNAPDVVAAEEIIDSLTLRLHSPRPVTAYGMARLRLVLADGGGPLYRYGRGDLRGRLTAAFTAL